MRYMYWCALLIVLLIVARRLEYLRYRVMLEVEDCLLISWCIFVVWETFSWHRYGEGEGREREREREYSQTCLFRTPWDPAKLSLLSLFQSVHNTRFDFKSCYVLLWLFVAMFRLMAHQILVQSDVIVARPLTRRRTC